MFGHGFRGLTGIRSEMRCPMREDSPDSTVGPFSDAEGMRLWKVSFGRCAMWTRI